MKLTNEMCEHEFATLPLDLKQWIIATAMELVSAAENTLIFLKIKYMPPP